MKSAEAIIAIKKLLFGDLPPVVPMAAPIAPVVPMAAPVPVAPTSYPLADGTTAMIDKLEVGGVVTINGLPAPDGEITLADGTAITTIGGIISEVETAAAAATEPVDMSTPVAMKAAIAKFAAGGTPGSADMAVILSALVENAFGYEIRRVKQDEAIAIYNANFTAKNTTQQEGFKKLVELVEQIAGQETAKPIETKAAIEKPYHEMSSLERFRATK